MFGRIIFVCDSNELRIKFIFDDWSVVGLDHNNFIGLATNKIMLITTK